jgi:poly-gamma-glutamate synthesis protein (capsule biosynthesis protein)
MALSITFCGDIALGLEVADYMGRSSVSDWLKGVSKVWKDSDLLIGNLEGPCVVSAKPNEGISPDFDMSASATRLRELASAGFSAVTLGNNHVMDCGPLGLAETIRGLDEAGIYYSGAGMNLGKALKPTFIPVGNLTVALVSFCYGPPASRSTAGVAPYHPKLMRKALKAARAGADIVIAALHDGLEFSDVPPRLTRNRFRFLAQNGADIVVGHHPHVLQGLEWHNGVPIVYSLGDLLATNSLPHVADSNFARIAMGLYAPQEIRRDREKFGRGALLTVHIADRKTSVEWHPFRQNSNLQPQLSAGETRLEDLQRLDDLSAALLDPNDLRNSLADSVVQAAIRDSLDNLAIRELLNLALKPKWRYIPAGFKWLYRRVRFAV